MPNIFSQITGSIPSPSQKDVDELNGLLNPQRAEKPKKPETLEDLVSDWQNSQSKDTASVILKKLKPTISSAINSYAPGMDKEMEIPAAKIALSSLKNYDPSAGTSPSTYVFYNLKRLNRIAANRSAIIKYPEKRQAEAKAVRDFMAQFEDDNDREPSLSEIADKLGMSEKKVDSLLNAKMVLSESSTIADDAFETRLGKKDLTDKDYYYYVYKSVGPVDQKIMEWASGLDGKPVLSNNEIARRLKLSPAAISQRKSKLQSMLSDVREAL